MSKNIKAQREYVETRTDKYFTKTKSVIANVGDVNVTYAVFMRREIVVAVEPAIEWLKATANVKVNRMAPEGTVLASEKKIFEYTGSFVELVELETLLLQKVGVSCVSAYNAFKQCMSLPKSTFMDMCARHTTGDDMMCLAAYGASVGSSLAKKLGAKGFVGSSADLTSKFYGAEKGMGTMPHALIGMFGSTLDAVKAYVATHNGETSIVALVDYFGKEVSDSIKVADWFKQNSSCKNKNLSVRLDTHGGRFCEGLDYSQSVHIVCKWLHVDREYDAVRKVMGETAYDMDSTNLAKDKVRKTLFGAGVSAANIINMRQKLDEAGHANVGIVASSGFDLFKCQIMNSVGAPINMVGTGSFLPDKFSETYATADIYRYGDKLSIKVGREWLMGGQ